MTGLGLGLTVSCKWVGLFTIAAIGTSTIKGLWEIWGNTRIPKVNNEFKWKEFKRLTIFFVRMYL